MTNKPEAPARPNPRSIKSILLISLLGALLGATAGFLLAGTPNYRSTGVIQIKPFLPGVFTDSTIMPRFDDYADAQVAIIESRRTMDMAMQNPDWKALGRGLTDKATADFQSHLSASRGGIIVIITFLDPDPNVARTAVKSVIQSYQAIYDDANSGDENRRAEILDNLKNKYQADIKRLRDAMQQDGFGPEAVDITYRSKLQDLNRMESELQEIHLELNLISATTQAAPTHASTKDSATPAVATAAATHHNSPDPSNDESNIDAMRLRARGLADQLSQCKAELKNLGDRKAQLDDLKAQETTALSNLNAVKSRLQQLTVESQIGGRISVISDGDTPLSPEYAPRKKATLLGLLLGTSLAAAIAFFITPRTQRPKPSTP